MLVELDGPTRAQALATSMRTRPPAGLVAAIPALQSLVIEFDPLQTDAAAIERALLGQVSTLDAAPGAAARVRTIPVAYGGEFGPDLEEVARLTCLSPEAVIAAHVATELTVLFDGFAPGFAYLGELPVVMHVPRLATPRTRTPRGSVAITGAMSGIYPAELPGGWRVIGRTPIDLFDATRDPPAYLVPGDRVRFEPFAHDAWDRYARTAGDW